MSHPAAERAVGGPVRLDRRTKDLCRRLRRGDVAVLSHADLDSAAAYALVEGQPAAVVNTEPFSTGRYPNHGPRILLDAGVPLFEALEPDLFSVLHDGVAIEIRGGELRVGDRAVAVCRMLTRADIEATHAAARANLGRELQRFSQNTLEYLAREADVALADLPVPPLGVRFRNRPALIVVRGEGYKQDLQWALPYIREQRPVLVAVDGGADALLEAGFRPDIILGDMDSATDAALRCGAELIVHAYTDGRTPPGAERLRQLGLSWVELPAPGTSEDVAMLLAYQEGASLLVAVGTHFSLIEFLDKRRAGMASTFLTRLRVGSILVDAKGVSRLYRPGASPALLAGVVISALIPILVVVANSAGLQRWLGLFGMGVEVWLRRHGL